VHLNLKMTLLTVVNDRQVISKEQMRPLTGQTPDWPDPTFCKGTPIRPVE
jgi:hypothetical protein